MSQQPPRSPLQMMLIMNLVICALLLAFAVLPLLAGWDPVITGLMLLPAVVWMAISWRMYREYKRRKKGPDS